MRGADQNQGLMYSYVAMERRIRVDHPARKIRVLVDRALKSMNTLLDTMYAPAGRPSIAPERLLRAQLLMILYSIRSERQLMEQLDYNLLFRWFVGLEMDDAVWDVTVFTKNRERLIEGEASQKLLMAVLDQARKHDLLSEEHFTVDATLIQAWASSQSFKDKKNPPARGAGSGKKGELLLRDKVESATDADARLYKKALADKAIPSYQGHALMENRNGLIVAAEASRSSNAAEREVGLKMLDRVIVSKWKRLGKKITLGGDALYQEREFIQGLRDRKVAPHIHQYVRGNLEMNCLTNRERNDKRRAISYKKRKQIEKVFGWNKSDRPLCQVKLRGLMRVDWLYRLTMVAYDLTRMANLIPLGTAVS
jgi:transposase